MKREIKGVLFIVIVLLLAVTGNFAYNKIENVSDNDNIITIASWNVENLGESKANNPEVMQKIANIISKYDVVVIQEVSNINEEVDTEQGKSICDRNINATSSKNYHLIKNTLKEYLPDKYTVLISHQTNDERYAVVFNRDKMIATASGVILSNISQKSQLCDLNSNDSSMVRNPFLVPFIANISDNEWEFSIITAHTSPSHNFNDLQSLQYNYGYISEWYGWDFGDVFLMGDLNADCDYMPNQEFKLNNRSRYVWIVPDEADTTVSMSTDCAYDRIITLPKSIGKLVEWGVDTEVTEDVSDHYPVWASFDVTKEGNNHGKRD